jgi:hypothetical protein
MKIKHISKKILVALTAFVVVGSLSVSLATGKVAFSAVTGACGGYPPDYTLSLNVGGLQTPPNGQTTTVNITPGEHYRNCNWNSVLRYDRDFVCGRRRRRLQLFTITRSK